VAVRGVTHLTHPDGFTDRVALWWHEAEAASDSGRLARARRFLRWILASCPDDENAWLWLARLASSPGERVVYLRRAYAVHPRSKRVQAALRRARDQQLEASVGELKPRRALVRCLPDERRSNGNGNGFLPQT
jgi:predicted Zn-dependent protease